MKGASRLKWQKTLICIILSLTFPTVAFAETKSYMFTFRWINEKVESGLAVKDDNEQFAYMTGVEVFCHGEAVQYVGFRVREATGDAATGYHVFSAYPRGTDKYPNFVGRHKFAYTVKTGVAGQSYALRGQYDDESIDTTPLQTTGRWTP